MPIPKGVPIVDLVLCGGVPTFKQVKFAVRTGEFTPYPNIILRAGVAFPV